MRQFVYATMVPVKLESFLTCLEVPQEITRRCLATEEEQYKPLFMAKWRAAYEPLDKLYKQACSADEAYLLARALAVAMKVRRCTRPSTSSCHLTYRAPLASAARGGLWCACYYKA